MAFAAFLCGTTRPALATLPTALCTGNPCNVTSNVLVDGGSVLDFGPSTDLRLKATAVLTVGPTGAPARSMRIVARSIVLEPGARILGGGDGAVVMLEATGGNVELQAAGSSFSRIDVKSVSAGSIDILASGDVPIAGLIDASGSGADSVGGDVSVTAGGMITLTRDLSIGASGTFASGGFLTMSAGTGITIAAIIDGAAPGDGASVDLSTDTGDLQISKKIVVSGGSPEGLAGSIDLAAVSGNLVLTGNIVGTGGSGADFSCGDGSEVNLTAGQAIDVGASININAGTQCFGGSLTAVAGTTFTQAVGADIQAQGPGLYGGGGFFGLQAGGAAILRNIDIGSPGFGGTADIRSSAGPVSLFGTLDARGSGSEGIGGSVEMQACAIVIAASAKIDTRGAFDVPDAGFTRLKASSALTVAGSLLARDRNELRVKTGVPLVTGTTTPAAIVVTDDTLPDCVELARCGDGNLDSGETCDDDNIASCDGCRNDCSRLDDVCGDGIIECGEQCDDGNTTDGDGCEADCTLPAQEGVRFAGSLRPTAGCVAQWELAMANPALISGGFPAVTQECIDGDPSCDSDGANNMGCTFDVRVCLRVPDARLPACTPGPIAYTTLRGPSSLTLGKEVDKSNAAIITDALKALGGSVRIASTVLQTGSPIAGPDTCTSRFTVTVPRSGTSKGSKLFNLLAEDVNGLTMSSNQMRLECLQNNAVCGNGTKETTEQCDDGNLDACDGCSPGCRIETCGDGIQQCNEQCDDGPANGTPASRCSTTCTETPPALRIPGGGSKPLDCQFEWAPELNPALVAVDAKGIPKPVQTCVDNDPTCDFDPAPGVCELHVWGCLGAADARLGCVATSVTSTEILAPSARTTGSFLAARLAMNQALTGLSYPTGPGEVCTTRVTVGLAAGPKVLALKVRSRFDPKKTDVDALRLKCLKP